MVNYSEDIVFIILENCIVCYCEGEIGFMLFISFEEVCNWGFMIKYVMEIKYMLLWLFDQEYFYFLGECGFLDEEIVFIVEWVDNDMLEGDLEVVLELFIFLEGL